MTLRFQNYNNALENDTHNIEIFYSVFENQNSCPILIERYIDLFVGNSFILSCYNSKPLQFLTSRTPSALGFNGNCIKGEFLMVKNCTSANMGVVVSFTNQTQDYDHISFDQCETKTGGCMNPNYGNCSLSNINLTSFTSSKPNGAIFLGNDPSKYSVTHVNLVNNNQSAGYSVASIDQTNTQVSKFVNFVNSNYSQSVFKFWQHVLLLENICIFGCISPSLLQTDKSPTYTFLNCFTDNDNFVTTFTKTDFTTNSIPDFTIQYSPSVFYCSVSLTRSSQALFQYIMPFILL